MREATTGAARRAGLVLAVALVASVGDAATPATSNFGPYHAVFLEGGVGLARPLSEAAAPVAAGAPWTISGWVRIEHALDGRRIIAALGEPASASCRCLTLVGGRPTLETGQGATLQDRDVFPIGSWHHLAATYDGTVARLFLDGTVRVDAVLKTATVAPLLVLAPDSAEDPAGLHHFGGRLAEFALESGAVSADDLRTRAKRPPAFDLLPFHSVGSGWPWQEHAWRGLQEPQPAWTLPHTRAPAPLVERTPVTATPALQDISAGHWAVGAWRFSAAPDVPADAATIARPGFDDRAWFTAVVPGTVLTTLIANGVYPDPDVGLNNLLIPESLNRRDYWYRTEFTGPAASHGERLTLEFAGINYSAEVWLNGEALGSVRGAFRRGLFDVTGRVHPGTKNALAVRVSPPPHPGIPHEQSVAAGPGENGGNLAIDGPTFIATEGWDWIPAIRDRNTGLWQGVELAASGAVRLGDPQVVTLLPLPRIDSAEVTIRVPVENPTDHALKVTVRARFDAVDVTKTVTAPAGTTRVELSPQEFAALRLKHPRLWWPNGYGNPALYSLDLSAAVEGAVSDTKHLRFGVREISYELSLFDASGRLRRLEVDPTPGSLAGETLVDVRHEAIKRTATGWAASLTSAGERSGSVHDLPASPLAPYLVIRVNGVRIAARGGSWGMDDSRKRVSRERLEPFFELHRRAHLNTIRNWLGQDTEEVFYDLADEYGLLVFNDFWASTQDFQVEPQDPALFLDNAADVIRRYRNHPSIALWFGRNEGVPQPVINEGLAALVATLDGTRYYTGSSNRVNLQDSGPYNWRPAAEYFTRLARGFAVEVGTPSLAERESLEAMIPAADRWPIGDAYAYHDWHFGGNGDTQSFRAALERRLGAGRDFGDFVEKAQLLNYEAYRAIFEGFHAGLWTTNSGRLLWMTHPSWPSNAWQIYTADYDTPAAYYAVAKANEPLHVQLDLPDFRPRIVNVGGAAARGLGLDVRITSLDGRTVASQRSTIDVAANDTTALPALPLAATLAAEGIVLVDLTLRDRSGRVLSRNTYWPARDDESERRLAVLPAGRATLTAERTSPAGNVTIALTNSGRTPILFARATLRDAAGARVLPAYYDDNYVSLLPGETRHLEAVCAGHRAACTAVEVHALNLASISTPLPPTPAARRPDPTGARP